MLAIKEKKRKSPGHSSSGEPPSDFRWILASSSADHHPLFNLIDHIIGQNIIEKKDAILLAGSQHAISCRSNFWRNGRIRFWSLRFICNFT